MKRRHPSSRVRKSSLQRRRCALERLEDRHLLAVLFADSFESGGGAGDWAGNWVEDGQNDWFRSTQRATNGTYSAEVDGSASDATLRLATPVDLTGYASAQLTFDWLIESGFDGREYLALDVSSDGGSSWQTDVRRLSGNVDAENEWHSETVDLTPSANLLIRFRSLVDRSSEDANVDNVQLVGSTASTLPWTQQAALTGVSQTGDLAGGIVAISGDTIAVTSALNDDAGLDAGAAYVYVRDDAGTPNDPSDDAWSQQASLIGSDTVAGDQFARSIDIQGDAIIVGAYQLDNGGNGAAYVFRRAGSTWNEVAKLTASDGASSDRFGVRVAIDGDTIVIGAQADNTVGSGSDAGTGAAYVFAEPVGGWSI